MLGYPAHGVPEGKRHRHELRTRSDVPGDRAQKFLISENLGTTELVNRLTCSTFVGDEPADCLCDVLYIDRLQLCLTPAEHWKDGKHSKQLHQVREKGVIRSEHDSGTDHDCLRKGRLHDLFALSTCADVPRR